MRRLYLQVYVAMVGILVVFGLIVALTWRAGPGRDRQDQAVEPVAAVLAELLPAGAGQPELEATLARLARAGGARLTLWGADGTVLAAAGERVPLPAASRRRSGWRVDRRGTTATVRLADGRWLAARHPHGSHAHGLGFALTLALFAGVVAAGAYPVARRLTRRLERLRAGVDELGGGDLAARVPVEGADEVADLARSFNRAADRIEALVGSQRALLASASHELRSPLARIRVALDLPDVSRPEARAGIAADIAELDALIEELLLASRLQSAGEVARSEDVDLLGLAAEEAARVGAEASGAAVTVRGDRTLLRRLVRNLLENARRHATPPVEVRVEPAGEGARLVVCDRGPGIPEAERERVFEPFYRIAGASAAGGAGLGLALVRQIARRHGGDARVLAREGGGACFEVSLASGR